MKAGYTYACPSCGYKMKHPGYAFAAVHCTRCNAEMRQINASEASKAGSRKRPVKQLNRGAPTRK